MSSDQQIEACLGHTRRRSEHNDQSCWCARTYLYQNPIDTCDALFPDSRRPYSSLDEIQEFLNTPVITGLPILVHWKCNQRHPDSRQLSGKEFLVQMDVMPGK